MILGEPTPQSALSLIEADGSLYCGEHSGSIFLNGPSDIVLEDCGCVVDARPWIDGGLHGSGLAFTRRDGSGTVKICESAHPLRQQGQLR